MQHPCKHPAPMPLTAVLSRAVVARNLGISESEVARIERRALLKARDMLERRGLSFKSLLALISNPTDQP